MKKFEVPYSIQLLNEYYKSNNLHDVVVFLDKQTSSINAKREVPIFSVCDIASESPFYYRIFNGNSDNFFIHCRPERLDNNQFRPTPVQFPKHKPIDLLNHFKEWLSNIKAYHELEINSDKVFEAHSDFFTNLFSAQLGSSNELPLDVDKILMIDLFLNNLVEIVQSEDFDNSFKNRINNSCKKTISNLSHLSQSAIVKSIALTLTKILLEDLKVFKKIISNLNKEIPNLLDIQIILPEQKKLG